MAACLLSNNCRLQACSHRFLPIRSVFSQPRSSVCLRRSKCVKMAAGNGWLPSGMAMGLSMSKNIGSQFTTPTDCVTSWSMANSRGLLTFITKWNKVASGHLAAIRLIWKRWTEKLISLNSPQQAFLTLTFIKRIAVAAMNSRSKTPTYCLTVDHAGNATGKTIKPSAKKTSWQPAGNGISGHQTKSKRTASAATNWRETMLDLLKQTASLIAGVVFAKPLSCRNTTSKRQVA